MEPRNNAPRGADRTPFEPKTYPINYNFDGRTAYPNVILDPPVETWLLF